MPKKSFAISVSGKGGVGKTNISALLVRCLSRSGSVLAIDADPDVNLPQALGIEARKTVGEVRERILNASSRNPIAQDKATALEFTLHEAIEETDSFDLIVMGRSEGAGCYCAVNHIIREVIDQQSNFYDYIVIDCEPGLEHLSRRTTKDVDLMILVTDPTKNGILTARRILELKNDLLIRFSRIVLLANKVKPETKDAVKQMARAQEMKVEAYIPYDTFLAEADFLGKPVMNISESSPALTALKKFVNESILSLVK